ncbi:PIP5K3 [Symbiodinium sp. CCMP2456]|nr:PIP5K3 [Symbiodinium sp. CCMP2456]
MGNAGTCCSSGGDSRCCGTGASNDPGHGPIDPLRDEVKGIDPVPAPGMKDEDIKPESLEAGSFAANAAEESKKDDIAADEERQFVTYQDGSTYTGMIKNGKRHGHGVWQSKSCQYEGQWKEDQQDGHGRQTWSDGRVYEGQFSKGRFSGTGKMVWHTQKGMLVYEGQYKEDLKDGHGMFIWPDGRTYDGEWREGKRHGRGTYITAKAERKVGYWVDDKFDRWEKMGVLSSNGLFARGESAGRCSRFVKAIEQALEDEVKLRLRTFATKADASSSFKLLP